jgi:hypothetical protein
MFRHPIADAACVPPDYQPVVLTTRDTQIPIDGGILVGWRYPGSISATTERISGDVTDQPAWKVKAGNAKPAALTRLALAPGLSVYLPPAGKGAFELLDGKGNTLGTFTHRSKAAKNMLPAPTATTLTLWTGPDVRGGDRHAQITLTSAPPADAVAIIVYHVTTFPVNFGELPLAFTRLPDTHDQLTSFEVFQDAGRCGMLQPGTRPPTNGENIAFAWVDAFGRRSPLSATIKAKVGAVPQAATTAPVKPAK